MTDEPLMGAADAIIRGMRARAAQVARAEEQLAAFAWHEDEDGPSAASADDEPSVMLVRAVRSALAGETYPVLCILARDGDATVAALAERMGVGRLAAIDRVGAWTQAGLVARNLETDAVGLTELGGGIVALVTYLSGAAAADGGA